MEKLDGPVAVDPELRETARSAWTFGLLAAGLTILIPCSSYLSAIAAFPLGLAAIGRARAVLEGERALDEATEVYARTGRILGLMSTGMSGLLLFLIAVVILLYAALLVSIFGAATLATPPATVP